MSYPLPRSAHCRHGFTLIELLIAVIIVGVLSAIAYPSFIEAIRKSRRADAISMLSQAQQAQERFRANNPTYASSFTAPPTGLGLNTTSPDGHYSMAFGNPTGLILYSITATANPTSQQIADTLCRSITIQLTTTNFNTSVFNYTSTRSDGTTNPSPDPCWRK